VAGVLWVADGGDAAGPDLGLGAPGATDPGGLGDEEIGDVGLVGTPRSARDGESGVGVELAGRGVEVPPAVPARLEFHEFHRDLYARLRRDAHLDDEAAQTVVNHVAMMGSSPEGIERAVAELDGLVARGLGQERLSAVRELLRQVAADLVKP